MTAIIYFESEVVNKNWTQGVKIPDRRCIIEVQEGSISGQGSPQGEQEVYHEVYKRRKNGDRTPDIQR